MAFCEISHDNLRNLTALVNTKIRRDPTALKNLKDFSQEILTFLVGKNVEIEKAIAMVSHIPQIISEFNSEKIDRKFLKDAGVSMDSIQDAEDIFDDYKKLANYLGIKNETVPIVVVNSKQLNEEAKITKHIEDTKVTFDGDVRSINGKKYATRVTSITKVGYDDKTDPEEQPQNSALKHGNTVDTIAKAIFDDINPNYKDFTELIEPAAFDSILAKLKAIKSGLQQQGFIFKTGITLYNKLGVSGEADLIAISPDGKAYVMDFKTANQRFNESYLKTQTLTFKADDISHDVGILSKWKQYGTQGYIYAQMLKEQLGIDPVKQTGIIGINISYDHTIPPDQSKIVKVVDIEIHNIPFSDVRSEMKDKNMEEIYKEYEKLKDKELGSVTEIKERKPLPKRTNRRSLDRLASIKEVAATNQQLADEVSWFNNNPIGEDTLLRISDMVNTGLFGNWTLDGIMISTRASTGTVYHEGWHRFSQVFMDKAQKDQLYNSVKKDNIRFRTRDGRIINTSTADFIDVEEFLAEEFAKYALNPSDYSYPKSSESKSLVARLFQKILDVLNRFFGINPRPIDLFQKLYTGKIADYVPSVNNAYWGNLNSLAENSQGQEIVSNERFPLYVRSFDYLVGKELRDAKKSFTAFKQSKRLQSQVLNNVFSTLEAKYDDPTLTDQQADEIFNITQNQRDFVRAYLKATSFDTLKDFDVEDEVFNMSTDELAAMEDVRDQYDDVEDIDESEETDSKPERFDRTGNEDSAYSIADKSIQDFFRTISKIKNITNGEYVYELNELGFPENHKFYDVFYKTKKILSESANMKEMLAVLADKSNWEIFPELKIISDFIAPFINNSTEKNFLRSVQNVQFVQSFWHVMTMPEVPNMQLTINYLPLTKKYLTFKPTMVSYRTASRNLSLKIIKTWEKNFKDRRNKKFVDFKTWEDNSKNMLNTALYLTEDGKLLLNPFVDYAKKYPTTLEGMSSFWMDMGVNINPKSFRDKKAIDELVFAKNVLTSNIAIFKNYAFLKFINDVDKDMELMGIDRSQLRNLSDYINAMPATMMDKFSKTYFIGNPISFFNEKSTYTTEFLKDGKIVATDQATTPMRFIYEDLASIEEKFGDRVSSGSFRIEDKTKYPYYILNQLLRITREFNKIERITQFADNVNLQNLDPIKNNWMKRSYFMKRMFDSNGNRMLGADKTPVRIIVEDIASVRTVSDEGILEKSPRSLTKDEKFFVDVLTLFRAGAIEIPRAETSSTMFSIRLSDYGKGKNLPISLAESLPKTGALPENFHAIVKDYFMAEIEKRQWWAKNDPDVKGANKIELSKQFNVFEGMLPQALKDKIVENLDKTPEEIFAIKGIEGEFRAAMSDYFTGQINEIRPRFDNAKTGLSQDQQAMIKDTLEAKGIGMLTAARLFVLNHFILSQEFYNIYYGDLYFYKNAFKRGKYVTNTGNAFEIDDMRNEMLNSIQNSTMHNIVNGTKPGGKDFRFINTSIMNDVEMKSSYVHSEDSQNLLLQGIINTRVDSGTLVRGTPEYNKFVQSVKDSLTKYNSINIADGQGVIGMDFYRNFSIITNIWSEKKEKEYERQKAIFRNRYNLYFKLDSAGNRIHMQTVAKYTEELSDAIARDKKLIAQGPFAFFNPLKISYTGPQVKNGPTRPVFDKFSVRPIIPEAAIGKRDEGLMMEMAKKDIDYVKFKSGSKVYQDSSFDWYNQISEGVYDMNNFKTEEITPNQLFAGYLKHQLNTEGFKEETIFGSQFRKIVFGIKYSPIVRDNASLFNKFTNLETMFKGTVDELIKVEENDLFSLLGVTESNGTYKVSDMKRFLKLLQTESVKRGVAINNIDYIQYDEMTKNAKYPIDYAFNRQAIQDLISGLIDDRLRRLKVNGSSLIQVSSAGTENKTKFTNASREDIEKYGTTGLHYYHMIYDEKGKPARTSTMGVKVALIGEYRNLLNLDAPVSLGISDEVKKLENEVIEIGQYISDNPVRTAGKIWEAGLTEEEGLKRLNQALKDPKWKAEHMDKLVLIGYRIPTQNLNFIDHMEIMEFLPQSAGSIIIPPIELIIKSGSDFDIDKMNVIRPSIKKNGSIVTLPKTKVTNADGISSYQPDTLEAISQKIREQIYDERELRKERKKIKDMQTGTAMDISDLEKIQKKIRMSILDLAMKASVPENFLDRMIANMEEGKPSILPDEDQIKTDMEAFSDEDISDAATDLERVTADYQQVDQEIERLKEKNQELGSEKGRIEGKELKWFNKKREYKSARNNDIVSILSELMSHPYYFESLVTPSSASMFEGYTNELMASEAKMSQMDYVNALVETEGKLYDRSLTPQQASTYGATSQAFDNLLSKRKDLGGYAIQRTFADIFNFAKLSIAKSYTVEVKKGKYETKTIYTPLMSPQDRLKSLENGRILMHGDSVTGIPISKSFDELISLTVDLAGAPAYPHMGINNYNKKHVQYLLHQKTDPKQVLWFINQPILKELFNLYEEKRRKIVGYTLKHAIVELSLRKRILENPNLYENSPLLKYTVLASKKIDAVPDIDGTVDEGPTYLPDPRKANQYLSKPYWDLHSQNLTDGDNFTFEEMDNAIRSGDTNTALQKKVLAYFASITEEADLVTALEFAENVDTTKYATLTSLIRNETNRMKIRNSDLFNTHQIDRIEKESMIAPFDYTQKAKSILMTVFPKLYTNRTIGTFAELVTDVFGAKNTEIERISKIIENDYIEYIYKNYGTYEGKNISDYFQPALINTDNAQDHDYFSYRLNAIKAKFPELLDVPFVDKLAEETYFPPDKPYEDSYKGLDNKEIHNIFFQRNPDNPTFEKNVFTNNWRNLINFDPERLGLKEVYNPEDIKEISNFFNELVYFSLYQSGLTNTGNGFSDLIPYEYWASFVQKAFAAYDSAKERNKGLEVEMLHEFEYRFRQMNPNIKWRTKTRVLDSIDPKTGKNDTIPIEFYKNYYRGKDYKVTDDDLLFARELFLQPDEDLSDDNTMIMGPSKPANAGAFIPGRVVEFEGVKHVIIKNLSPGIWQLYNPLEEGSRAKTAARESKLTALNEMNAVVVYGTKVYLVTSDKEIIDLDNNKKLSLTSTNRNRINILKMAEEQQKPPETPPDAIGPTDQPPIEPKC